MILSNQKFFLLAIFSLLFLGNSESSNLQGRDFHGYLPPEEEKKFDNQIFPYPPSYYPVKDGYLECENNPMLPFLGKALNFFVLKLGVLGIVKAVAGLILLGLLAKLPIMMMKLAFLKTFFLPFLLAPLFIHLFANQMNQSGEGTMDQKPSETPMEPDNMMGMNDMSMGMERQMTDNFSSVAWQSMKMFAESDQCVERVSCIIGASNSDSSMGKIFSKLLKFLHYSSSPNMKGKISSIREAFTKGSRTLNCSQEDFKCESPELLIQHGITKVKLL